MFNPLDVIRKKARPAAQPAPVSATRVRPPTDATGTHAVPDRPDEQTPCATDATNATDPSVAADGCDPYNSGMFDRRDSWSRVNKRS